MSNKITQFTMSINDDITDVDAECVADRIKALISNDEMLSTYCFEPQCDGEIVSVEGFEMPDGESKENLDDLAEDECPNCGTINHVNPERGGQCDECLTWVLPCNTCPHMNGNICENHGLPSHCDANDTALYCHMFDRGKNPVHNYKWIKGQGWEGLE